VHNYRFENGRRYHIFREGAYNFPNDETEQDREDLKHAMVLNLCGGRLHFANIGENPQNILDMGTGTGIWAIESESSSNIGMIDLGDGRSADKNSGRFLSGRHCPRCRFKSHTTPMGSSKR
jgi:hypothetical protein